jgi:hypothetical protein
VQRLAQLLNVPTGYFYTEDDALAELMVIYYRLGAKKKGELIKTARHLSGAE